MYNVYRTTTVAGQHEHAGGKAMPPLIKSSKWLPTKRTINYKGTVRKIWCSAKDTSVMAVKRIVTSANGIKKARFERLGGPNVLQGGLS